MTSSMSISEYEDGKIVKIAWQQELFSTTIV